MIRPAPSGDDDEATEQVHAEDGAHDSFEVVTGPAGLMVEEEKGGNGENCWYYEISAGSPRRPVSWVGEA